VKPTLQLQVNEPKTSVHWVLVAKQLCAPLVHSLLSAHVTPLPPNPGLHVHVNDVAVSMHVAAPPEAQLCTLLTHSFSAAQVMPLPE
jgi:hypothetical protein